MHATPPHSLVKLRNMIYWNHHELVVTILKHHLQTTDILTLGDAWLPASQALHAWPAEGVMRPLLIMQCTHAVTFCSEHLDYIRLFTL